MTQIPLKLSLRVLLGIGCIWVSLPASADEVVTVSLLPASSGGQAAMSPRKIELSGKKPGVVTKEVIYRNTPRYGVLTLGDARENQIVVVLDAPATGKGAVRLFVDSNGNGDLTDEPALTMAQAPTSTAKTAATDSNNERYVARTLATARYNVAGRGGTLESGLAFTYWGGDLTVNREYNRAGTLKIGEKNYKVALADQGVSGTFDDFKHGEDDPAKVTILIDKNGDGVFNMKKESFDAVKPFRIGASVFEVASIDPRGTKVTLRRSGKALGSTITAKDLRVGGETIAFETDKFGGKPVMFPDDYKGKIVLLDFWAVWCPPCREEVPNIVRTYEQFHKEGFEILGVSLDRKGDDAKLKDFMKEFGMTWEQIFDGGYWKAEIAQLYGVNSIPHAVLVDGTTGTILAMGDELRGNGLQAEVEKALSKKR